MNPPTERRRKDRRCRSWEEEEENAAPPWREESHSPRVLRPSSAERRRSGDRSVSPRSMSPPNRPNEPASSSRGKGKGKRKGKWEQGDWRPSHNAQRGKGNDPRAGRRVDVRDRTDVRDCTRGSNRGNYDVRDFPGHGSDYAWQGEWHYDGDY